MSLEVFSTPPPRMPYKVRKYILRPLHKCSNCLTTLIKCGFAPQKQLATPLNGAIVPHLGLKQNPREHFADFVYPVQEAVNRHLGAYETLAKELIWDRATTEARQAVALLFKMGSWRTE